jgi:hypothetical protein
LDLKTAFTALKFIINDLLKFWQLSARTAAQWSCDPRHDHCRYEDGGEPTSSGDDVDNQAPPLHVEN